MQNKRKLLLIALAALVVIIAVALYLFLGREGDGDKSQKPKQEFVSSMEGDEVPITEEDEERLESMVDFAIAQAQNALNREHPNAQSILLRFTEWYFTEANKNSNVLTVFSVVDKQGDKQTAMKVIEINSKDGKNTLVSIYPPDDRYSIYE